MRPIRSLRKTALFAVMLSFGGVLGAGQLAAQSGISLGGTAQNRSAPVEIFSDQLSVSQADGTAVFTGNAQIRQGSFGLEANRLSVLYTDAQRQIAKITADGDVFFTNGVERAEAKNAIYDVAQETLHLTGDVLLLQGQSAISGDDLILDLVKGTGVFRGNVRTSILPNNSAQD